MSTERERVRPITPKEVTDKQVFPDAVIESFNELIAQNGSRGLGRIIVNQDEAIELMVRKGLDRQQIFEKHWLDIEDVYKRAGWQVEYDKPAYNETPYTPYFTFSRRRQR